MVARRTIKKMRFPSLPTTMLRLLPLGMTANGCIGPFTASGDCADVTGFFLEAESCACKLASDAALVGITAHAVREDGRADFRYGGAIV
jgi:hypothetical protein